MGLFDMAVGTALQVSTHGRGAAAHEGADGFKFEQGLGIALVVLFEVIAKETANGGFHGVRLVPYMFFYISHIVVACSHFSRLVQCPNIPPRSGSVQRRK